LDLNNKSKKKPNSPTNKRALNTPETPKLTRKCLLNPILKTEEVELEEEKKSLNKEPEDTITEPTKMT